MKQTILYFLLSLFLALPPLRGQSSNDGLTQRLHMNEALDPPQDILSSKSVVLLDVPKDFTVDKRTKLADELQAFFAEEGIDAVAYFTVNSFSSVGGMEEQIPNLILNRGIKNLIFVSVVDSQNDIVFGIGPFNGKNSFYDKGAIFWVRRVPKLQTVFNELSTSFKTGAFPRENLLVNTVSEFFEPIVSGFKQAYATLPTDFEGKKIAIPQLDTDPIGKPGPLALNIEAIAQPEKLRNTMNARMKALSEIAHKDSLHFQIFNLENRNDTDLRRARVDYVLHFIEANADNVYGFLPFKDRKEQKKGTLVKFFLRDTRSNNIYLGAKWDASENWQEALNSFFVQIEQAITQKPN